MANIEILKHWSHKIIPLIYDESLSYYEQVCTVAGKLNEVINSNNDLDGSVENIIKELKELKVYVDGNVKNIDKDLKELKVYVDGLLADNSVDGKALTDGTVAEEKLSEKFWRFYNRVPVRQLSDLDAMLNTDNAQNIVRFNVSGLGNLSGLIGTGDFVAIMGGNETMVIVKTLDGSRWLYTKSTQDIKQLGTQTDLSNIKYRHYRTSLELRQDTLNLLENTFYFVTIELPDNNLSNGFYIVTKTDTSNLAVYDMVGNVYGYNSNTGGELYKINEPVIKEVKTEMSAQFSEYFDSMFERELWAFYAFEPSPSFPETDVLGVKLLNDIYLTSLTTGITYKYNKNNNSYEAQNNFIVKSFPTSGSMLTFDYEIGKMYLCSADITNSDLTASTYVVVRVSGDIILFFDIVNRINYTYRVQSDNLYNDTHFKYYTTNSLTDLYNNVNEDGVLYFVKTQYPLSSQIGDYLICYRSATEVIYVIGTNNNYTVEGTGDGVVLHRAMSFNENSMAITMYNIGRTLSADLLANWSSLVGHLHFSYRCTLDTNTCADVFGTSTTKNLFVTITPVIGYTVNAGKQVFVVESVASGDRKLCSLNTAGTAIEYFN